MPVASLPDRHGCGSFGTQAYRFIDLMKQAGLSIWQILPLNRTYLSQLINAEYGCSFYQFVTNYRIEEAKRVMVANPFIKMQDVAEQCGFSSPTVFARIFSREVGMTPSEWSSKQER